MKTKILSILFIALSICPADLFARGGGASEPEIHLGDACSKPNALSKSGNKTYQCKCKQAEYIQKSTAGKSFGMKGGRQF